MGKIESYKQTRSDPKEIIASIKRRFSVIIPFLLCLQITIFFLLISEGGSNYFLQSIHFAASELKCPSNCLLSSRFTCYGFASEFSSLYAVQSWIM